ncbi:TPA: amidohydrolase [Providencia alcalifaciens]|uniref:Amidohydrolase family protein n=1 Tax=Providencia alcalifaciens 205/92 TaxID=1256988 RepID=A0AAV3M366_9GAMM|nr:MULTISPECIES: amidohydrolase [Providencia]ETT04497.1 amidohydrolase family protein [Providencia alcalifaciens F90-2004]EUC96817.1 amidohydrolase family protein [Providencia alcalifaciens PAL-2]EUD03507.1 amidohydrolase family protein [Providencia alcalifaciens RIMD 1656011]EUD06624.1 amidohydrolase family protein [Providencia alcalifaciens R90-1475]EUD10132.1 amidohydrolase family protein [Providencia alcalifaciens 205/92]
MTLLRSLVAMSMIAAPIAALAATPADLMIVDGTILTMDAHNKVIENGTVVIDKNKIVAVGGPELTKQYTAKKQLNVDGDIVMPGLINTHTHASMTVFRSLADDVPDRLHRYIFPLESKMVSREMVRVGANLANVEMLKGGVTTYVDMYYFEDEVAKTVDKIGMRAILGESVIKFPVADAQNADEGIAYAVNFINQYKDHPRITPAFAPHAPYTNTTEHLQKISKLSQELDVPVMIHLAETDREQEEIAKRTGGKSPVQYMADIGALNSKVIAAHAIMVNDSDIDLLKQYDVGVAHNVSANTKSAKGVAPVTAMLAKGVRVGLGTDGPMSSNTLTTMNELNLVGKIHKLENKDRAAMPPITVVELATKGSAKAIHMEDKLGSLEAGKLADIIVVDTKSPNMVPMYSPYAALVYGANASNVRHSIVDGSLLMEDRKVLTVDESAIVKEALQFADQVRKTVIDSGEVVK